jgi:glycosyltransferase involved in cell wall biosynthesis
VVANWLQQALREHHGKTSVVVPNGVDTARFRAHDRSKGQSGRVGFLYSRHPRKNVQLAIQALERARAKDSSLQATSFGVNPRPQDMPEWIDYEQRPSQDRIPQIYASCDLSLSEGFGLPLLEAMASGTPVLAARAGAAPDLIDGTNGWLVEADPEVMARSLLHFLAQSPEQWLAASRAARHTAEAHDVARASQTFEDVLLSLIDQPQGT